MKKFWKLSNKLLLSSFFCCVLLAQPSLSETKDIWQQSKNIKPIENKENLEIQNKIELPPTTIGSIPKTELQISSINQSAIEKQDREVIFGIYDPKTTNIPINFWRNIPSNVFDNLGSEMFKSDNSYSTNELIKKIFFSKTNLSNLDDKGLGYLNFASSYLAKSKNTKLIDSVIDQNDLLLNNEKLLDFLVSSNFSSYQIDKACKYAVNLGAEIKNYELQKIKIFCLVKAKENKKALANLELIREGGFKDEFFIQKINYLLGMLLSRPGEPKTDTLINIHLSSLTDPEFNPSFSVFQGDVNKTRYFFNSPFVTKSLIANKDNKTEKKEFSTDEDFSLIQFLEEGSNLGNFSVDKIYSIYKKIIFGIDDLLLPQEVYLKYHPVKGRALLYQSVLLTRDQEARLKLINLLRSNYQKNKLSDLGDKIYFSFISSIDSKYLSKETLSEIADYAKKLKKNPSALETNNKLLHQSDAVFLLIDKSSNSKHKKILENFGDLVSDKKYEVNVKDIAFINLLAQNKIDLPGSLKKFVSTDEIYIPNKIYNMLDKKENDKATLELLLLAKNLQTDKEYVRNFLVITKILDRLGFDSIKKDFVKSEFFLI